MHATSRSHQIRASVLCIAPSAVLVLAGVLGTLAAPPAAAETKFYVAGSVGRAHADYDGDDLLRELRNRGWAVEDASVDRGDTAWRGYVGVQFMSFLAVELGWLDGGTFREKTQIDLEDDEVDAYAKDLSEVTPFMPEGATLGFTATLPLGILGHTTENGPGGRTTLRGKFGIIDLNADVVTEFPGTREEQGTEIYFGLGAGYRFNDHISVIADWERYELDTEVDLFTATLQYTF